MVNTKKYGDEHFAPKEGGMKVTPSAGPLPLGFTYVPRDVPKEELIAQWRSLIGGRDVGAMSEDYLSNYRNELRTRLTQLGVDVNKL